MRFLMFEIKLFFIAAVSGDLSWIIHFPLNSINGNGDGIYIPHFLYVYIQMRFTFKSCEGEIGHQHIHVYIS